MEKVILYYAFTPLPDPAAIRLWQRTLAASLGLRGRILLSEHGINGTLGGEMTALKRYIRETREYPGFKGMEFKWSAGSAADFPKLSVKVRPEIVTFGVPDEVMVDENGIVGGGVHLSPQEVHELVEEKPEAVFFDGRNAYESEVGRFKGAIRPEVSRTEEFVAELDSGRYDHLKQTPVITYCTGGIRCEVLSSLMVSRGFEEVYQLDGGIAKYGEAYGDKGLWEGSLYVFDQRGTIAIGEDPARLAVCRDCGEPTSEVGDCSDPSCLRQFPLHRGCTAGCEEHAAAG